MLNKIRISADFSSQMFDCILQVIDLAVLSKVAIDGLQSGDLLVALLHFLELDAQNLLKFFVFRFLKCLFSRLLLEGNDFLARIQEGSIVLALLLLQLEHKLAVVTDQFESLLVGFLQSVLPHLGFLQSPLLSQIDRPELVVELLVLLLTFLELRGELVELSMYLGDDSGAISEKLLKMRVLKGERADLVLKLNQTVVLRERIELLSDEMNGLVIDLRLQLANALIQTRDLLSLVLIFFGERFVVGLEEVQAVLKSVEIFKTHLLKQIINQRIPCC